MCEKQFEARTLLCYALRAVLGAENRLLELRLII
jgi:hypothetical protein